MVGCAQLCSCVQLFAAPWIVARQAPLSMGILQARILEWVAMPSSRGSSWPRDPTQVSCTAGGISTVWATIICWETIHHPNPSISYSILKLGQGKYYFLLIRKLRVREIVLLNDIKTATLGLTWTFYSAATTVPFSLSPTIYPPCLLWAWLCLFVFICWSPNP